MNGDHFKNNEQIPTGFWTLEMKWCLWQDI